MGIIDYRNSLTMNYSTNFLFTNCFSSKPRSNASISLLQLTPVGVDPDGSAVGVG